MGALVSTIARSAGLIVAISFGLPVGAAELLVIDPDAPAGFWTEVQGSLAGTEAVRAEFQERRENPFRRRPAMLGGTIRFDRERGLSLHYDTVFGSIIVIDAAGIARKVDGESRALPIPESERAAQEVLLDAFQMDFASLSTRFEIAGEHDQSRWLLRLTPRETRPMGRLRRVTLEGTGRVLERLTIEQEGNNRIRISLDQHQFDEEARDAEWGTWFR